MVQVLGARCSSWNMGSKCRPSNAGPESRRDATATEPHTFFCLLWFSRRGRVFGIPPLSPSPSSVPPTQKPSRERPSSGERTASETPQSTACLTQQGHHETLSRADLTASRRGTKILRVVLLPYANLTGNDAMTIEFRSMRHEGSDERDRKNKMRGVFHHQPPKVMPNCTTVRQCAGPSLHVVCTPSRRVGRMPAFSKKKLVVHDAPVL
jgi:hypothetical protein